MIRVLREDKKMQLVRLPVTLPRMLTGRWALQSGKKLYPDRWKDQQVATWRHDQQYQPVSLRREGHSFLWWFQDRFYWHDDRYSAHDVQALVLQRARRDERRLRSAHSLMKGGQAHGRERIPSEVRRAVIARDGRRCVRCGSTEELQFDHILPVGLGGATTVSNLQVLCADCNRDKSDLL